MSVDINDKTGKVISDTTFKSGSFMREIVEKIVNESQGRTPKKTGALRRNVLKQVLGKNGKIIWKQPYASIQEDVQFKNYTTAGTGPHYAERAVKKVIADTDIIARRVYK